MKGFMTTTGIFLGTWLVIASFAAGAYAQTPQANGAPAAPAAEAQPTGPMQPVRTVEPSYWDPIGGFELDTHGTSYSFFGPTWVKPLSPKLAFQASVRANYLTYEFEELGGVTKVRSPGVSTGVGLKMGDENWFRFSVGVGVKRRNETFEAPTGLEVSDSDWESGVSLGADTYLNPTERVNVHGQLNYGAEDGYVWSRLGVKRQLSNYDWRGRFTHYAGGEVMAQGNEDIRSLQLGGLVEFLHAPSSISIMLRGGWKRSTFDLADDKTGPYVAVGYFQRLK